MKTNRLLAFVIVLQGIVLLSQWTGGPRIAQAGAQIPDPGAQRLQLLDEQKATNEKLDRLINLLESGKLQVIATMPDDKSDGKSR